MPTIKKFEDLEVWQLARNQANLIWQITNEGIFLKNFELKDQINRAAGSVMDNIAEGFERFSTKEFVQFLIIAKGSNAEVRSQLYRAFDRKHITEPQLNNLIERSELIGRKILAFVSYLQTTNYKSKPKPPTSNLQPPTLE